MKNLKEKFNDKEEGEELQEILSENDSDGDKGLDNINNQKIKKLKHTL